MEENLLLLIHLLMVPLWTWPLKRFSCQARQHRGLRTRLCYSRIHLLQRWDGAKPGARCTRHRHHTRCTQTEASRPAFPLQNNNAIRHAVTMSKRFRKTTGAETIRSLCKGSQGKQLLQSRGCCHPNQRFFSIFHSLCGNYSFASRQSFHDKFGRGYAPSLMSWGLQALP